MVNGELQLVYVALSRTNLAIMKKFFSTFIILILLSFACNPKRKSVTKTKTFDCLTTKIDELSKQSCEKGASVKEYKFMGKTVFVIDQGTCGADLTMEVLDSECKNLGYLGGISGNTQIGETDFSEAEFVKTIWEK
jgi:hypothetical protein